MITIGLRVNVAPSERLMMLPVLPHSKVNDAQSEVNNTSTVSPKVKDVRLHQVMISVRAAAFIVS